MGRASQSHPVLSLRPVNVSSVCKVVETLQMFKSCRSWQVELRVCRRKGHSWQSSFLPPTHQSNGRSGKYIDDLFSVLNIEANIETILPSHPSVTILYLLYILLSLFDKIWVWPTFLFQMFDWFIQCWSRTILFPPPLPITLRICGHFLQSLASLQPPSAFSDSSIFSSSACVWINSHMYLRDLKIRYIDL